MRCNGGHFLDSVFLINNSDYSFFQKKKKKKTNINKMKKKKKPNEAIGNV
jgi:hypothetical protein